MRWVAALAMGMVAALATVSIASGHAEPARITPGDGAVLTTPPAQIEIELSQETQRGGGASDIDVFGPDGTEVTVVGGVVDNGNRKKLSVVMPATLAPGEYRVHWKTLSTEDGDAAEGDLSFTYDPNGTPSEGTIVLREDLLGGTPTAPAGDDGLGPVVIGGGSGDGTSWVLVVAVAIGMFVLGGGTTFLLVQKRT